MAHGLNRPAPNFCEVCGVRCPPMRSLGGWQCCRVHLRAPKPDRPRFDCKTGERLAPGAPDPVAWRRDLDALREIVSPIDHLDFEAGVELEPDELATLAALDRAAQELVDEQRAYVARDERVPAEWKDEMRGRWLHPSGPGGSPDPTRDEQTDGDGYLF